MTYPTDTWIRKSQYTSFLGNQLFPIEYLKQFNIKHVFMKEDIDLCTYEKHHKQKITLFLSAMRSYRDMLKKNKITMIIMN